LAEAPDLRERVPEAALAVELRNRVIHGYDRVESRLTKCKLGYGSLDKTGGYHVRVLV
jgi:hypothetical protein